MFKKNSLLILALTCIILGVNAQESQEAFLRLSHYAEADRINLRIDDFSLTGAEVLIEGNTVSIIYDAEPTKNCEFIFDRIKSFEFGWRTVTAIFNVKTTVISAYFDYANILYLEAREPLGQINVFSVTGMLVASQKTDEMIAQINMSTAQRGVFIVQAGINRFLIIKN